MKAIVIEHRGEARSLKDIPIPVPASHEVLVRVTAAGVNPIDWKRRERGDRPFPFVLGQDFAGVVSATGDRVTKYREGERIFGISARGALRAIYRRSRRRPEPARRKDSRYIGDADAGGVADSGLTALAGVEALHVKKGTTFSFLVRPAASAATRCRSRTIAARTSSAARLLKRGVRARSIGVDEFVAYDREDVGAAVKAAHPGGVDAVSIWSTMPTLSRPRQAAERRRPDRFDDRGRRRRLVCLAQRRRRRTSIWRHAAKLARRTSIAAGAGRTRPRTRDDRRRTPALRHSRGAGGEQNGAPSTASW